MSDDCIYYVDCDPGIDDALALLYLLRTRVAVASIDVVSGNVEVAVAEHTRRLLALAGRQGSPISVVLHHPLVGESLGATADVHGADGFELSLSDRAFDHLPSADRRVERAHARGSKLRIIALGPITNIAAAITQNPTLPQLVDAIAITGAAYRSPGNITVHTEANIYADPYAADRVLSARWRDLLLLPLDVNTLAAALAIDAISLSEARECWLSVRTGDALDLGRTVVSISDEERQQQSLTRIALTSEPDLAPLLLETVGC